MRDNQFNWMLGHLKESQKHLFAIQERADVRNRLLTTIKGSLVDIPSGQGGLDFQSGSRGGLFKYHKNEQITVTPNVQHSLSIASTPVTIQLDSMVVAKAVIKHLPDLSKMGYAKYDPRGVRGR